LPTILPATDAPQIRAAIRNAAHATDTDFDYLLAQARVESALDPAARARSSSAAGLFQFTNQTWLETVQAHGAEHGLGWAAEVITSDGGHARVADPTIRQAVMDLRFDPSAASLMAGEFAGDNADYLSGSLGRAPDSTELYLAHFLGAEGARRFIRAHDADPSASAANLFPDAAAANRGVFYAGSQPRSLGEVREFFAEKLGAETQGEPGGYVTSSGNSWPPTVASAPQSPRPSMAEVLRTSLGPIGAAEGTHVARAYSQLSRFGL
jgi:hypothetical protein